MSLNTQKNKLDVANWLNNEVYINVQTYERSMEKPR